MLRIRIPGGALTADQLAAIGRLAQVRGRNLADVTDRQNIQLHWIVIEDVPAILDELDRIGLSSLQACGDTVRNVLGCPVAGVDAGDLPSSPRFADRRGVFVPRAEPPEAVAAVSAASRDPGNRDKRTRARIK